MEQLNHDASRTQVIDDFVSVTSWMAIASGEATLDLTSSNAPTGKAMQMVFDFHGSGGFAVARKELQLTLPAIFAIRFKLRGEAPVNHFELKLVDETGKNVWWHQQRSIAFPNAWQEQIIKSRDIVFAWGPSGDASLSKLGAIELAITADQGGKGTIWIADLTLENRTLGAPPLITASSHEPKHEADASILSDSAKAWRTRRRSRQWLAIDFRQCHEYGGLTLHWINKKAARDFDVESSEDGQTWTTLSRIRDAQEDRSFIPLPDGESRYLRLQLLRPQSSSGFGIRRIEVLPYQVTRTPEALFAHIARTSPTGYYPRYLTGQQSYWTPVGTARGAPQALVNEEGLIELQPGSCSIEPFLFHEGRLITWADAVTTTELADGFLPIPIVRWNAGDLTLTVTACALDEETGRVLHISYRLENTSAHVVECRFFLALRPFQVTPPWQKFKRFGGMASIQSITINNEDGLVNGTLKVGLTPSSDRSGAAAYHQGVISSHLSHGNVPEGNSVEDADGLACAAWVWDVKLAPGDVREIHAACPGSSVPCNHALAQATTDWRERLGFTQIELPGTFQKFADSFKTAAAHILLNRDGAAFQPGSRRYTRSWIRDGAMMGAALLRAGSATEMRDFIRWYAVYQADSGAVPCCVDEGGADWLVEHDSHGQLVFAVAEYVRFTGDMQFLRELWPAMGKALAHLQMLLLTGGEEGLLPESASHEGYLAHPVHAYWDDFWALRAFQDAADMAAKLGEDGADFAKSGGDLAARIQRSMAEVMEARGLTTMPGSVEWADFDPTATSNAVALLDLHNIMPADALAATFRLYLDGWQRRQSGAMDWTNYTAYEVRIIGAMVRMGWRDEANELLRFLVNDQRPAAWHQWPEISWRDPRSPGHLGDVPHSWISAEYMLSFRDMLAHEHLADNTLALAAGLPLEWLVEDGVRVDHLPTYFGSIAFTLRRDDAWSVRFTMEPSWANAPVAVMLRPPLPARLQSIEDATGAVIRYSEDGLVLQPRACEIVIHCSPSPLA